MKRRPLIIGQAPSLTSDPNEAVSGRSGERLADLCGLTPSKFCRTFERVNLNPFFPGKDGKGAAFDTIEARRTAIYFITHGRLANRSVVMLGDNVANSFGLLGEVPKLRWFQRAGMRLAFCPHPSGVCHWWNDEENRKAARRFWRRLVAETSQ